MVLFFSYFRRQKKLDEERRLREEKKRQKQEQERLEQQKRIQEQEQRRVQEQVLWQYGLLIFKRGIQNWKNFCLKINIPKGNY